MLKQLVLVVAVAAAASVAHPQYSGASQQDTIVSNQQGQHPATQQGGGNYNSFTPQQSHHCGQGSDCVPWITCKDGYINVHGEDNFDLRKGAGEPPAGLGYTECGATGNVCCLIPDGVLDAFAQIGGVDTHSVTGTGGGYQDHNVSPLVIVNFCSPNEDCVIPDLCQGGKINTDGEGLIDLRKKTNYRTCINHEYNEVGVCCRIPDTPAVSSACPDYSICTDYSYCNAEGVIVPNSISGYAYQNGVDCWTNPGVSLNVGVCCFPPPPKIVQQCPNNGVCTSKDYCDHAGIITKHQLSGSHYVEGLECYLGGSGSGVGFCCQPPAPLTTCPAGSSCTGHSYCDNAGVVVTDIWSGSPYLDGLNCYLNAVDIGVCCQPPPFVHVCPNNGVCTSKDYCDHAGIISKHQISGSHYVEGLECYLGGGYIGGGGSATGFCCHPPAPLTTCPHGTACTGHSYCDDTGTTVANIWSGSPYLDGANCFINAAGDVGVCCKPLPVKIVQACPNYGLCTSKDYCDSTGIISKHQLSGWPYAQGIECYSNTDIGVCCQPPPPVTVCPYGGVCTGHSYCDNRGLVSTDIWSGVPYLEGTDCFINSVDVGVCCQPPPVIKYVTCPVAAECIPEDFCFGDLLDSLSVFQPYSEGTVWSECSLPGDVGVGVCCQNPLPDVPNTCGVSHYANTGDNLKTKFYNQELNKLEADFGEMPWQAIVFYSNYTFKCGASLISERHLLTVGHCVDGLFPYDIRIRLGEWQVNTFNEPLPYIDIDVTKITVHPEYRPGTVWNNIAIIELKEPVNLGYNINNICLPFGNVVFNEYTRCIVSGWGKDSFEGNYQHVLKKIDVPLINHHACQALLRKTRLGKYFRLHDSYRCAGGEAGKDACVGDGGGPLICYSEHSQSYVQVGITAWGIGCGQANVPGVYTDLNKFTPWISSVTGLGGSGSVGAYGK